MDDGYPCDDNSSENEDDDQNNPEIAALEQPPPAIRPWGDISFDLLMQYEFKAYECPELLKLSPEIMKFHNPKRFPYVHKGQTFRRSLCEFYYKPQICPSIPHCKDKNKCQLAHNIYEYCLHPDIFGNTICRDGIFCTTYPCLFAHSSGTKYERPPLLILPPRPPPTPRRAIVSQPPLLCRQTLQPLVAVGEICHYSITHFNIALCIIQLYMLQKMSHLMFQYVSLNHICFNMSH
ncbi:hypothetical protein LIER_37273 [Lithospermum erythrorhizon]|uniref:C3H1-type domain-containing protein n=1 Tax=Lithospermum erythrorhizon TaxID=34254 RepID=A0AAV3PI64_LITER